MRNIKKYIHNAFFTHTSFVLRRLPSKVAGVPVYPSNVPTICNIPNAIFTNPKLFKHRIECNCISTCKYNETNISLWKVIERRKKYRKKNDTLLIHSNHKHDPSYPPLL